MNPKDWYEMTIGKKYDIDGYYGFQCWDYFAYFCKYFNLNVNTHCSLTGFAGDLWKDRFNKAYSKYFTFITDVNQLRNGDWCFWDSHVAMYYDGKEVGQNQNYQPQVTAINFIYKGFLGAMRFKKWMDENKPSLSNEEIEVFIRALYKGLFNRKPSNKEVDYWKNRMLKGLSCEAVFKAFINSNEYKRL